MEIIPTAPVGATNAVVRLVVGSLQGTLYLDDLYFGPSMVPNGGFETDTEQPDQLDGWVLPSLAERVQHPVAGGQYALHLAGSGDETYGVSSSTLTGLAPGTTYHLHAAVAISPTEDLFRFEVVVAWQDGVGSGLGSKLIRQHTAHTAGMWTATTADLVVPEEATRAEVQLIVTSVSGDIFVDDVVLWPERPTNTRLFLPHVTR